MSDDVDAIWSIKGLRSADYRVIWWLIDAGATNNILKRGWINECSDNLGIHRITLNRILRKLCEKHIASRLLRRGEYILNASAFNRYVDREKLTKRQKEKN